MVSQKNKLFCFGFGCSAQVLARRLLARGWSVAGTVRPPSNEAMQERGKAPPEKLQRAKLQKLQDEGFAVHFLDRVTPIEEATLTFADVTHVLVSIPPGAEGDVVLVQHRADLKAAPKLKWIGYLSTTGVYGTRHGGVVTEADELRPSTERSRQRAGAESDWLAFGEETGLAVQVFRLAGIYGPERNPLKKMKEGKVTQRVFRPGQVFSRIHVEDIATVLEASIARPRAGAAYNVCDDTPEEPATVAAYSCELLGIEAPPLVPFEKAEMTPMARSFWNDNKRVDNSLIKQELGVELAYPDYKSGYQALLGGLACDKYSINRS